MVRTISKREMLMSGLSVVTKHAMIANVSSTVVSRGSEIYK
jgi:hypothetical protein